MAVAVVLELLQSWYLLVVESESNAIFVDTKREERPKRVCDLFFPESCERLCVASRNF